MVAPRACSVWCGPRDDPARGRKCAACPFLRPDPGKPLDVGDFETEGQIRWQSLNKAHEIDAAVARE